MAKFPIIPRALDSQMALERKEELDHLSSRGLCPPHGLCLVPHFQNTARFLLYLQHHLREPLSTMTYLQSEMDKD